MPNGGADGVGGYGGGAGHGNGLTAGGGGGAGLGGAVFVRQGGSLVLDGVSFGPGNSVSRGAAGGQGATAGSAEGAGLFLMGGGALGYSVGAGQTVTVAAGVESDAAITLTKTGAGVLVLSALSDFSGFDVLGGTLQARTQYIRGDVGVAFGATLDINEQGGAVYGGVISGAGALTKSGASRLIVTGANTFTGTATVSAGELTVSGSLAASTTTVMAGAILTGAGTVQAVTVQNGGTLAPGPSTGLTFPGVLHTGAVTLAGGAILRAELGGTAAGQFDQLHVTGTVSLGGATLDLSHSGGFTPSFGASFEIIDNDGADAVTGTFAGLAQGATVTLGGYQYAINYTGGDGNDVVLTVTALPAPPPPPPLPTVGSAGADMIILGNDDSTYAGQGGDDQIWGMIGNDSLQGNAGNDTVDGGSGDDLVRGGQGDDRIQGGDGADRLFGDLGADTIRGGQGDDVIDGGDGADWLSGDKGADTLTGGAGADVFHVSLGGGKDLVTDFNPATQHDRVLVDAGVSWTMAQVGADTVVTLSDGTTLTLAHVTAASLPQGWIFAA